MRPTKLGSLYGPSSFALRAKLLRHHQVPVGTAHPFVPLNGGISVKKGRAIRPIKGGTGRVA